MKKIEKTSLIEEKTNLYIMLKIKEMDKEIEILKHKNRMKELETERSNQKTNHSSLMDMHRIKRNDDRNAMLLKNQLIREGKRS